MNVGKVNYPEGIREGGLGHKVNCHEETREGALGHLGQVVYSKAGRDKGKCFIVTGFMNDNYVLISDGDLRRIENPKKKKIKHLVMTEDVIETLAQKISTGSKVTNADIRKMLAEKNAPAETE